MKALRSNTIPAENWRSGIWTAVPFTKKARRAYAVLATGETALYANPDPAEGRGTERTGGRGRLNGKHSAYALCRGASPCI